MSAGGKGVMALDRYSMSDVVRAEWSGSRLGRMETAVCCRVGKVSEVESQLVQPGHDFLSPTDPTITQG